MSDNPFRLPRHVVPSHYDIQLEPDLETFTFTGSVGIDVDVITATSKISLNAAEIDIKSATLTSGQVVAEISYDEQFERATLHLADELEPGSY